MQFTSLTFLSLALTAVSSSANAFELPAHPGVVARAIEARGTDVCTSAASTIVPKLADMPTPPAALSRYMETASVTQTDPCVDPVITGSVGSEYSSYATAYTSWVNAHMSDLRDLWKACSDVPSVVNPTDTDDCSSMVASITSNPGAAGPRETGAIAAAALFAAGAVAAAL